jgi:hypothetical protein
MPAPLAGDGAPPWDWVIINRSAEAGPRPGEAWAVDKRPRYDMTAGHDPDGSHYKNKRILYDIMRKTVT